MKLGEPGAAMKRGSVGWRRQIAYVVKEVYGSLPPPPQVSKKTLTLNVHMGSKEALPHKGRTAVSWPRRGGRGLHLCGGACRRPPQIV